MNQIKRWRKQAALTQAQLATLLGVVQSAVASWESGDRMPRADKLPQLARALGCTIDDLYDRGRDGVYRKARR